MFMKVVVILVVLLAVACLSVSEVQGTRRAVGGLRRSLRRLGSIRGSSLSRRYRQLGRRVAARLHGLGHHSGSVRRCGTRVARLASVDRNLICCSVAVRGRGVDRVNGRNVQRLLTDFGIVSRGCDRQLRGCSLGPSRDLFYVLCRVNGDSRRIVRVLRCSLSGVEMEGSEVGDSAKTRSFSSVVEWTLPWIFHFASLACQDVAGDLCFGFFLVMALSLSACLCSLAYGSSLTVSVVYIAFTSRVRGVGRL